VAEALLQANGIAPPDKGRKRAATSEDLEAEDVGNESDSMRIKELEVGSSFHSHPLRYRHFTPIDGTRSLETEARQRFQEGQD
jgi:hypothetical protein